MEKLDQSLKVKNYHLSHPCHETSSPFDPVTMALDQVKLDRNSLNFDPHQDELSEAEWKDHEMPLNMEKKKGTVKTTGGQNNAKKHKSNVFVDEDDEEEEMPQPPPKRQKKNETSAKHRGKGNSGPAGRSRN